MRIIRVICLLLALVGGLRAQETVTYDTLADLLAVDPRLIGRKDGGGNLKARVEVAGRTVKGDGGGGLFDLIAATGSVTNRGTLFRSANTNYAWTRLLNGASVTPQMFGARGNGVAADFIPVQAALNYAVSNRAQLKIPAGTYLLTNKLVIPVSTSGWSIAGDGAGSVLKQTASSGNGTPIFEFAGGGIDRFSISDLALEWSDVGGVPASGWKNVGFMFAWDGTSDKGAGVYNFSLERLTFTFGFRCVGNYDLSASGSSGVNIWGLAMKSCRVTYMAGGVLLLSNAGSGGSPNVTISDVHVNGTTYGQPVASSPFIYSDPQFFCDSATSWSFHGVEINNLATSVPAYQFTGPAAQLTFDNCRVEAALQTTTAALLDFDNVGVAINSFEVSNLNVRTNIAATLIQFDNSDTGTASHELVIGSLDHQGNPTYPTLNLQSGASMTLVDAAVGTLAFVGNLPPVIGATTYGRSGPMLNGAANWRFQPATVGTNYTPVANQSTNAPNWFRLACASNTLTINAVAGAVPGAEYVFDLSSAGGTRIAWVSPTYEVADIDRGLDAGDRKVVRFLFNGTNMVQTASLPAWGGGNRVLLANANQGGIAAVDFSIGTLANTPTNRWRWGTDGSTESGSNAGSNLALTRYSDNGTNAGTPISINRATGQTTLTGLTVGTSLMSVNSGNTGDSLVRTNGGWYPLPVTGGGGLGGGTGSADNRLLRADGTGGATVQNSAVVVEDYTSSTANNVAIRVDDGTTANISAVITPKGTGAFIVGPRPDGTATGGNARGQYAVDFQMTHFNATSVAVGNYSLAQGYHVIPGNYSIAVGTSLTGAPNFAATFGSGNASSDYSLVAGQNVSGNGSYVLCAGFSTTASGSASFAVGNSGQATGANSSVLGREGLADKHGQLAISGGQFAARGDSQSALATIRNSTSSTSATELFTDGSSGRLTLANNSAWTFEAKVTGITAGAAASYSYMLTGLIRRGANAASTSMPVAVTKTVIHESNAAADVDATADTTNGSLRIAVTAFDSTATRWSATVSWNQVGF